MFPYKSPLQGQVDDGVEAAPVYVKCGHCEHDAKFPPAQKCHSYGGICCTECIPGFGLTACLVCEDIFRSVDVIIPKDPAVEPPM